MDLSRVLNILTLMPSKHQKTILSLADFNNKSPRQVLGDILDAMIAISRNAAQKEILLIHKDMVEHISEAMIIDCFGGAAPRAIPLSFDDEQIEFINRRMYRNTNGQFRIIPNATAITIERLPLDGLAVDEDIISAKLMNRRSNDIGAIETFDGLKQLRKQHYEPPYEGVYERLAHVLQRINIISSFEPDDPVGFFARDGHMYRNVCYKMTSVNKEHVNDTALDRAMLLMYLVSGATQESWQTLYNILHYIIRCPNSSTGYILYLNDFDAGGNGKSKFISIIQRIFGDSFTAFEPHQLRFNISLMGKRLVHMSEYEDNETSRQLQGMLKAMTGRDKFQYEGKGMDPVVAETYQNFIISSNRYIYFDDAGIKRRLQNFHCSNFLHLLLTRYFKSSAYLNDFLGNPMQGESSKIATEMAHSLHNYILNDNNQYDIRIKPQTTVLGSLKNPVLRVLFGERCRFDSFIRETKDGSIIDICRIAEAKPEQYNYAAAQLINWIPSAGLQASRDALTASSPLPAEVLIKKLQDRITELDSLSLHLKNKSVVYLETAQLGPFNSDVLVNKFFGQQLQEKNVNVSETETGKHYS